MSPRRAPRAAATGHGKMPRHHCPFTNEKMTENRALYERIGYVEYKRLVLETRTRVFLRKPLKA
ncbi:hypothetical protein GmRootV213_48010 [Variovorax sp. V213]